MNPHADSAVTVDPNEGDLAVADARVVRIFGQMLELRIEGPSPAAQDLFVGVDDPELRVEIATLPGDGLARGLLLSAGEPVALGARLRATESGLAMPVGPQTLGRMLNLFGQPIDGGPPLDDAPRRPILAPPPALSLRRTRSEIFETGIKAIDLLCPIERGGKAGGSVANRTVTLIEA